MAERAARVLVIRTDKVGDMLLSTPAIKAVRAALPGAHLTVLASVYNEPAIRGWKVPDDIEVYDQAWPLRKRMAASLALRRRRFDLCLVLHPDLEAYAVARVTGAAVRVGLVHARRVLDRLFAPALLTHSSICRLELAARRGAKVPHEIDITRTVVELAGLGWGDGELDVGVPPEASRWADNVVAHWCRPGATLVGFHLSEKWFEEGWTAAQVSTLLTSIASIRGDVTVMVTHGSHDADAAGRVRGSRGCVGSDGRVVIVAVDFSRWAAMLSRCAVVVTRDTGSLHLSSALKRPVVALYASEGFARNSQQFAPWRVPNRIVRAGSFVETEPAIVGAVAALLGSGGAVARGGTS